MIIIKEFASIFGKFLLTNGASEVSLDRMNVQAGRSSFDQEKSNLVLLSVSLQMSWATSKSFIFLKKSTFQKIFRNI